MPKRTGPVPKPAFCKIGEELKRKIISVEYLSDREDNTLFKDMAVDCLKRLEEGVS